MPRCLPLSSSFAPRHSARTASSPSPSPARETRRPARALAGSTSLLQAPAARVRRTVRPWTAARQPRAPSVERGGEGSLVREGPKGRRGGGHLSGDHRRPSKARRDLGGGGASRVGVAAGQLGDSDSLAVAAALDCSGGPPRSRAASSTMMRSSSSSSCCRGGQFHGASSGAMAANRSTRGPRPLLTRVYAEKRLGVGGNASILQDMHRKELQDRIREKLQTVELSTSSYDTAWVAMVPLRGSRQHPCFPQCVEWILQNQQDNGSWCTNRFGSAVTRDVLSSTLACVLALKRWNLGEDHIRRGLNFIGRNFSIAMDEQFDATVGFNVTFPGMLSLAMEMDLEILVRQTDIDRLLRLRETELKRESGDQCYGRKAYMAYVSEGLGNLLDWDEIMIFQRKNGSFFNCPSTTAATLINHYDNKALEYLNLLVSKFGRAVPPVYPLNIYCQLSWVDALDKMGISEYFATEIKSILDTTYSSWLERDEEIMLDITTCAMSFRILRMNGYHVSSAELFHIAESSSFHESLQGYINDRKSVLELYKASKVSLSENDLILDSIGSWSGSLLKEMLCSNGVQKTPTFEEMEYALKFPFYTILDRLYHKRNIEHFDSKDSQMLKTEYLLPHGNQDILTFAIKDFSTSQSIYQDELNYLDSWVKDEKLDQLAFARQKLTYCYLSAAATIFPPELSDARIAWAKNGVLTTVVDDFFDLGGSKEELENLVDLVEKWDGHHQGEFYSEQVKIVFCALYTTVNQLGAKASALQGRDVTKHLVEIWLCLLRSMMTEAEWQRIKYVPTMEEYMGNAVVSFALGPIVLPTLYFVGSKLHEDIVKSHEYNELFRLMSTCGRLLNDSQGFEREDMEGKLNSISLLVHHSDGSMSIEEAKRTAQKSIDTSRRSLLRLVLGEQGDVPGPCKQLFWKMCKIVHMFYFRTDGFSSPKEMVSAVNAVVKEPLKLKVTDPYASILSGN